MPLRIQAGSKLAGALAGLTNGDRITFSGEFIVDEKGCARERSITTGGSFDRPQLLFRFTTINGAFGNQPPPVNDPEKLRSFWISADVTCTMRGLPQDKIDRACQKRAALDARLRSLGWCFGKTKPGDADHWHKCGTHHAQLRPRGPAEEARKRRQGTRDTLSAFAPSRIAFVAVAACCGRRNDAAELSADRRERRDAVSRWGGRTARSARRARSAAYRLNARRG